MSETAELAAALAAVQAELPDVKKNRTADVKNKEGKFLYAYAYADLADVSAAVLPVLGRHGLAFASFPGHQEDGKFGLRYFLLHSSGQSIEGFFEIDDKGGMQLVGGRITYARRYTLCAVTGITADEDVDARGEQQPSRTAQRKPRTRTSPPAQAAPPVAAASPGPPRPERSAGGDLPPLPGEEEPDPTTPAAPAARGTGTRSSTAEPAGVPSGEPDDTDFDTPGTVTPQQLTAIWTILGKVFHFGADEKDQARAVCAHIVEHELETSNDLSHNEAKAVLDTLAHWQHQAKEAGEDARAWMIAVMQPEGEASDE